MSNGYVKKLTGKNPQEFEFAAAHIINNSDLASFKALVEQSDFLFDFIKKNVSKRLSAAVTPANFKNLLNFLMVYSYDYENFIVLSLVKYANEELTDEMLELFENGTDEQKAYCAKYFAHINDTLAIDLLRKYSYSDFDALSLNCAEALSAMKDEFSYNLAIEKLKTDDEFEKLSAASFLVAYNDTRAIGNLFEAMKKSSMPENIASEIPYLQSFLELLDTSFKYDAVFAINHIINGLGEIVPVSQIFDFQLFQVLEKVVNESGSRSKPVSSCGQQDEQGELNDSDVRVLEQSDKNSTGALGGNDSRIAVVLLNAKLKFEQLTENEEYIFDEEKTVKDEIYYIRDFLNSQGQEFWNIQKNLFVNELSEGSDIVFSALELVHDLGMAETIDKLKELLNSSNQTVILKTVEVIKALNKLVEVDKTKVLTKISDNNIKLIIQSLFN